MITFPSPETQQRACCFKLGLPVSCRLNVVLRVCHARQAVIGAGAAGLVSIRELLREGHQVSPWKHGAHTRIPCVCNGHVKPCMSSPVFVMRTCQVLVLAPPAEPSCVYLSCVYVTPYHFQLKVPG